MSLAQVSVRRPVLMTVLAIGTVLLGLFGAMSLGVREYPNVDSPIITVSTNYSGANAAVVEAEVTEILEESINSASGIKSLTSTSSDGSSTIKVEFEVGTDLETAANDIRDRVSRVQRKLPDNADAPTVSKSDSDSEPILIVSLLSDTRDAMEISEIARNQVKEKLQTIPGVSEVSLWGEKQPVVRLWLDPLKMQALGITAADISAALDDENQELPAGKIQGQTMDLSIRTLGRLKDPAEFAAVAIKTTDKGVVRLSDVAQIHYEPKDPRTGFKRNGKNVIAIAIIPQPGSNHVEIANEFYKRIENIKRELPSDVAIVSGMDTSVNIRASIREVVETIIIAFLLVLAVIFLFLREGRTTLIPMITVPISLVGSFFVLYFFGFSINVLTLLAMVLAIGLVVDDAIVIVENIYHKVEHKMTPDQAAVAGTNEIFFAVIATSMVLMAVFVPMLALGGTTGLLFREFVTVMIGTVLISTVSALTLSPMLCSKFLRQQKKGRLFMITEPFFEKLNALYAGTLDKFMKVRGVVFVLILTLVGIAFYCFTQMSSEMAPQEDSGTIMVNASMPEGVGMTRNKMLAEGLVDGVTAVMDSSEYEEIQAGVRGNGSSMIRITLNQDKSKRRSQSEIARAIQGMSPNYPDMRIMVIEPQSISKQRGGLPVQFVLQAPSIDVLRDLVPRFMDEVSKDPTFTVVNSDLKFTKPELHIEILRDKAREEGVSVADIASAVELGVGDQSYGDFYKNGRQYDIIGAVGYEYRDKPTALSALTVRNKNGELVPLDHFVTYVERSSSPSLPRYNRFSSATISAGLAEGKTVGDGVEAMRAIAQKVLKDYANVSTDLAGSSKEFEDSSSGLAVVFLLALAFIFLVLAGQFESFRDPLVIIFTVPLAIAGALATLFLTGQTLNIFSEIALILLLGIVTKNGILIVEFANQIAKNTGCNAVEAATESAKRRFRPILMTSLSTVLGAVPLILTGTPSRVAMGVAIVGGLTFATFMTLFVVPAAYSFLAGKPGKTSVDVSKMAGLLGPVLLAGILFAPATVEAAPLTSTEAMQIALQKKYSVQIANANVQSATANATLGSHGMLPTLDLSLSRYYTYGDESSTTQAGVESEVNDDLGHTDNLQLALNYTVFNGFKSWSEYQVSKASKEEAEISLHAEMENTANAALSAYYAAVGAEETLRSAKENLTLSHSRRTVVQQKYEAGAATRLDYLNANLDDASDSAALLSAETELRSALRALDAVLGGGVVSMEYALEDSIVVDLHPTWETSEGAAQVKQESLSRSASIQSAIAAKKTASLKRDNANANLYPEVNVHGSWNMGASAADKGNPAESDDQYFKVGASLNWNLFNGLADQASSEMAKIEERTAMLQEAEARLAVETDIADAMDRHLRALDALVVAQSNQELAEETVTIAEERLKAGSITSYEFRETQNKWNAAQKAVVLAKIEARVAELRVRLLSGEILGL